MVTTKKALTFICRSLVAAALLSGSAAFAADAKSIPANPLPELQGRWYAAREKVTVDIKDNAVVIVENTSTETGPTHAQYRPGLTIARLGDPVVEGKQVTFKAGECWTMGGGKPGFSLQKCPETGRAFYETRGKKPHWKVYIDSMILVRKEQLGEWESSRK